MAVAVLVAAALSGCSLRNPFRSSTDEGGYLAPANVGEGDCAVEILNLASRPLYVYYFLGLRNPPHLTSAWTHLGVLDPGQSSLLRADCEHRLLRVAAYATSPTGGSIESSSTRREITLVRGRRDVLRLRLTD